MSFTVLEAVNNQFEGAKANMMQVIVEVEQFLSDITWTYFDPNDAPTSIGRLWSEAMNNGWEELNTLEKYRILPSVSEFIDTAEEELDNLVDRFFEWTNRAIVDTKSAAAKHDRSTSTIYRWIRQGKLEAKKVNGRWQIVA